MKEWLRDDLLGGVDKPLVEEIVKQAQRRGDQRQMAWGFQLLAYWHCNTWTGSHEASLQYGQKALAIWRALNNTRRVTNTMVGIAYTLIELGELDQAQSLFEEVLDMRRNHGSLVSQSHTLFHLSWLHFIRNDFSKAEEYLRICENIQNREPKKAENTGILHAKAISHLLSGQLDSATAFVEEMYTIIHSTSAHYRMITKIEGAIAAIRGDMETLRALTYPNHPGYVDIEAWESNTSVFFMQWLVTLMCFGLGENQKGKQRLYNVLGSGLKMKSPALQQISLPIAVIVVAQEDDPKRAVELLGLAYTAPQEVTGWIDHWQLLNEIRANLEANFDVEDYRRIWDRGAQLDLKQVIRDLLQQFDTNAHDPIENANQNLPHPLTPKELEVLGLLAQGLRNPQIAERLFITTGTVKGHVNKILHKLAVSNRQQAAIRARELELVKT